MLIFTGRIGKDKNTPHQFQKEQRRGFDTLL